MRVFWKQAFVYPEWLNNHCKVSIKWPKVTHRYPSWTQRMTSKWPQSNPKITTLARRSHHFGDFGTPKSPVWQHFGDFGAPKLSVLTIWAHQNRHFHDFGALKSSFWRLWRTKLVILTTLAHQSRHFGNFGAPKLSLWGLNTLLYHKVVILTTLAH